MIKTSSDGLADSRPELAEHGEYFVEERSEDTVRILITADIPA